MYCLTLPYQIALDVLMTNFGADSEGRQDYLQLQATAPQTQQDQFQARHNLNNETQKANQKQADDEAHRTVMRLDRDVLMSTCIYKNDGFKKLVHLRYGDRSNPSEEGFFYTLLELSPHAVEHLDNLKKVMPDAIRISDVEPKELAQNISDTAHRIPKPLVSRTLT
jgi:hypothetical protein